MIWLASSKQQVHAGGRGYGIEGRPAWRWRGAGRGSRRNGQLLGRGAPNSRSQAPEPNAMTQPAGCRDRGSRPSAPARQVGGEAAHGLLVFRPAVDRHDEEHGGARQRRATGWEFVDGTRRSATDLDRDAAILGQHCRAVAADRELPAHAEPASRKAVVRRARQRAGASLSDGVEGRAQLGRRHDLVALQAGWPPRAEEEPRRSALAIAVSPAAYCPSCRHCSAAMT